MFGMTRIADDLKKFGVPMRTANVFRRTSARPSDAARIGATVGWNELFEFQCVLPVITEVVAIAHRIGPIGEEPCDRYLPTSQARSFIWHLVVREANSYGPPDLRIHQCEFVKVIVLPAHRVLNCDVKIPEGIVLRDLNATPHQWIRVRQNDQKLADVFKRSGRFRFLFRSHWNRY